MCLDWLSFGLLGGFGDCFFGQRHVMQSGTVSFMYPMTVESIMCMSESVFNYKPHCSENGLVVCDGRRVEMEAPVSASTQTCINSFFFFFFPPPSLSFSLSCQSNKVPVVQHPHHVHPLTPLITYSNEHFTPGNPPPHLQADVDPKTGTYACTASFTFMNFKTGRTKPKANLQA